jgi:Icc-related predicted phosphoesterase
VRVLLVSDLHYDLRKLDWVLARAADPDASLDVVVVAGDLLDIASSVPLDTQITVVLHYLDRLRSRVPTVVCSGNHDLDSRIASGEKITRWIHGASADGVAVDGASLDLDGWRLTACAWWEGPETLADLEGRLEEASADHPPLWAWAYHGPPEGALSWTGARHYGDPELPRLLERFAPDLVLCGHVHEAPFTAEGSWVEQRGDTWLFNAGRQRGLEPSFVEIDVHARTASWHSATGRGTVDLDLGLAGAPQ